MKQKTHRLLSLLLTLAMVLGMLPAMSITAFAEGTRTPVTAVTATLEDAPIYYGRDADDRPSVTYDSGQGVVILANMIYFQEYVDGKWKTFNDGVIVEGKWRISMQVRTKGTDTVLDPNVTLQVNGVEWERANNYSVGDTFSYVSFYSPEFEVKKPTGGELSFSTGSTIIPKTYTGQPIAEIDLNAFVSGGIEPYTFTKVSGPEWISVSDAGKVNGTPTAEGANDDLVVKVTDAPGTTKSATIKVKETILDFSAREKITAATASLEENPIYYGRDADDRPSVTYDSGQGVVILANMIYFQEYVDGKWKTFNDGVIVEGKWRISMQVRTKGTDTVLDPNVTLQVNGVEWERANNYSVGDTFSYVSFYSPEFSVTAPPTLEGTATLSSAYYNSPVNPNTTGLPSAGLSYKWQRSNGGTSGWANISGATKRSYTPGEDDVGKYIRVVITADGYEGSVISNGIEVKQALINFEKPVMPTLSYDGETGLVVTNAKANQEYLVTYNNTEPSDWLSAVKPSADGNLALSASPNTTVYVHTRVAETPYKPAGMYTDYNSTYTGTPSYLVDFAVNYSKLSLKVGEVVKLTATPIPADATAWQTTPGVKWYSNDASAKLYKNEACTDAYDRDTDGFAESVYIKGISQKNWFTVGAERTISGGIPTVRLITVAVTDTEGNYVLERLAFPDVTLAPGESVTVDIASYPDPSKVEGNMTFEAYAANPASTLTLTPSDNNTKLTIEVPEDAVSGGYGYNVKLDGSTITTNVWTVTVAEKSVPVDSVSVLPSTVTLAPGESVDLTAIVSPSNATGDKTVIWSVDSGSDKISVDNTGKLTASADAPDGAEAVIKATAGGKSGTCTVKVAVPTYGITVLGGKAYESETEMTEAKEGTLIDIVADTPASGKVFDKWEVVSGTVTLADATQFVTLFAMPAEEVIIQTVYKDIPAKDITAADVTVTAPAKGDTPADAATADKQYTIANTSWEPVDDPFAPSTVYSVVVTLETKGGYQFTDSTVFTINGNSATVVTRSAEEAKISFTFPATASSGSSSGGSSGGGVSTYAITVDIAKNGDVTSSHKSAAKGTTITLTVEPDKGYTLETITATDASGNKLKLTEKDGKYTFTMPASKVTVKATFMEDNSMLNFFVDVPADAYYYDAVLWAAEEGITGGVDATHFAPNATCTRAQAVTFLWRAAGSPAPKSSEMPFTDVAAGSYYETAVLWAVENGITKGTSDTTFTPNAKCTRAQIVTFLWRSQKSPAADSVNPFTDVAADAYYNSAVLWAAENGITGGTSATTFSPNNDCTRAQIVTFLWRALTE